MKERIPAASMMHIGKGILAITALSLCAIGASSSCCFSSIECKLFISVCLDTVLALLEVASILGNCRDEGNCRDDLDILLTQF